MSSLRNLLPLILLLLMSGCANKDMQAKNSGFLSNYKGLEEHDKLEGTRIHIAPGADFTKYENIYIEDVQICNQDLFPVLL